MTDTTISLIRLGMNVAIVGLIFYSIILHEYSHAFVANLLGDDSAKRSGRLSLNPMVHIDWFGTVILPLILYYTAGFIYGYAKPVPFNPYNFRDFKRDSGLTALAGPITNILIATFFALVYHLVPGAIVKYISFYVIFFNLILAFFNLIPVPPLDGSKVLGIFLSDDAYYRWTMQERKGMMFLFGFIIISNLLRLNIIGRIIIHPVTLMMKLLGIG